MNCPNCKTELPEHGELEYRFCPRCGAEITTPAAEIADNFMTIPPDLSFANAQDQETESDPERVDTPPVSIPDQTMEPVIPATSKPRPELVPPPDPPPASFFREGPPHPPSVSENPLEAQIQRPRSPLKLLTIIGAVAILIGGIIFLFLV
jgi:hypothetical protein